MYTAECAVSGTTAWLDIDIKVDGVELPPTGANDNDAFCSADTTAEFDHWSMHTAMAHTGRLGTGVHRVEIFARPSDGTAQGWLGDSSLLITSGPAIPQRGPGFPG
jgi:hypothetical protein